jgi:hypothetical protein
VLALLGSAVLLLPATGQAAPPSKCITDGTTWRGRSILPDVAGLGARVFTTGLFWSSVATSRPVNPQDPADPAYQWPAGLDATLDEARQRGVEPVLYVNGFPAWSNGGRSMEWAPDDPQDLADFMAAAVKRYPQVRRWQVVSEPGKGANFQPQGGGGRTAPQRYARLLDAAYGAMHAARKNVVVIGGNLHPTGGDDRFSTSPPTFLKNMKLPSGARPRMDLFGMNPYSERRPRLVEPQQGSRVDINDLDWLLRRLDQLYPGKRLRVFIGEFGWQTEHGNDQWFWFVPMKQQAEDLTAAYRLAARVGRIDTLCWFQLHDAPVSKDASGLFFTNWTGGLRKANGEPKPSQAAFRKVARGPKRV